MLSILGMDVRAVDLNLLKAFDALTSERAVTRAAARIGLSQPAMSHALSRLRGLFADDLFVRTPTGLELTARAREIAPLVAAAIGNAVFDATGIRLRQVPFTAARVKAEFNAKA